MRTVTIRLSEGQAQRSHFRSCDGRPGHLSAHMSRFCHHQWAGKSPELLGRGTLQGSVMLSEPGVCVLKRTHPCPGLDSVAECAFPGKAGKAEVKGMLGKVGPVRPERSLRRGAQLGVCEGAREPGFSLHSAVLCHL